jgi:hypothetical protein
MLPKEEKVKKSSEPEQEGLFDKENEKERIAKKRKFIYIAMALTVGLSISFWLYRSFKTINLSPPKIELPTFNFSVSKPKDINLKLPNDLNSTWSIFLKKTNSSTPIYQNNQNLIFETEKLDSILTKIDKSNFITPSLYSNLLPPGVKLKEIVTETNNSFTYSSKIITPDQELLLIIKISDSKDLSTSKKLIPNLIDQLYWYSRQK